MGKKTTQRPASDADILRTERDLALDVLRQIADRKRRTQEQRLAKSCVVFIDALRDERPNRRAGLTGYATRN